jgi:hypothetical protein
MFTIIACVAVVAIAVWTDRLSDKEMVGRPAVFDDDLIRQSIVLARGIAPAAVELGKEALPTVSR